jgi:6-pyruvoyltetrahydropterin/6-carboxytetrahydropterin synthase
VDEETGMVINIKDLDRMMREAIEEPLDHHHYNLEVEKLKNVWPTLESLVPFVWDEMIGRLGAIELCEVQIFENPDFSIEYRGGVMVYLTRVYRFSAAHRLHSMVLSDQENCRVFGKCNNLHGHGHDYVLEVTVSGEPDLRTNCLLDIGKMDRIIQEKILDPFDHVHLNLDTEAFRDLNPTSENIVRVFWGILINCFKPAELHRLRLWETSKSYFDYTGEQVD